jgi:[ribosomal protein S18]-alanine N-acetyltransferase
VGGKAREIARLTPETSARGSVNFTVRSVQAADVPSVAEIERRSFPEPWAPEAFAAFASRARDLFLVAESLATGGCVQGYVVASQVKDEAEILNLAVTSPSRGQGVGAALLSNMIELLGARSVRQVFLEVRESNEAARRLYSRHGFATIGRRRRYYNQPVEDALVLRLILDHPQPRQ